MSEREGVRTPVAALAVAMAALAVFALALGNDFAYDDVPILLGDPRLRPPLDLRGIFTGGYWQNSDLALYRPVVTLSFALDWVLAPQSPAWFHLTNALLHAAASVLAFLVLARLFEPAAALFGGLVFAVHPVHVEAVANIVGRAELLAAVFVFAACLVWDGAGKFRTAAVAGLYALALLSKESAIMLPALLVLLDAGRGERFRHGFRAWARARARPLLALAAVAALYLVVRHAVLGGLAPGRVDPSLELARSGGDRILTALQAWPVFARLFFLPDVLLADYGPRILLPADGLNPAALAGAALVACTVLGGAAALAAGARRAAFGLLWFPVSLLPVSNLLVPIGVVAAERTLYLPSLSLAVAAAGVALALTRVPAGLRRPATAAAAVVLIFLAGRSVLRIPDWKSTDSIMAALVRDRPDSFRGTWHGARFLRQQGDPAAASAAYDRAIQLWPHRQALVIEAAAYAVDSGRLQRAAELASMLVRDWPDDVAGYRLLAGLALDSGDRRAAADAIQNGLRLAPADDILRRMAAALDSTTAESR